MNELDFKADEFEVAANRDGEELLLRTSGTADARVEPELAALLDRVHVRVLGDGIRRVIVDLRELEFMTSSWFKGFVTWIVRVRRLPEPEQYHIRFRPSAQHHWQKRSLHAISYFGGELVTIEGT